MIASRLLAASSAAALVTLLGACGSRSDPQSEDFGNILASPGGLVLVEEEHEAGWGRQDCFVCHDTNNMHQVNRTGLPDEKVDLPGIRAIIENQGLESCELCHGDNGVSP